MRNPVLEQLTLGLNPMHMWAQGLQECGYDKANKTYLTYSIIVTEKTLVPEKQGESTHKLVQLLKPNNIIHYMSNYLQCYMVSRER